MDRILDQSINQSLSEWIPFRVHNLSESFCIPEYREASSVKRSRTVPTGSSEGKQSRRRASITHYASFEAPHSGATDFGFAPALTWCPRAPVLVFVHTFWGTLTRPLAVGREVWADKWLEPIWGGVWRSFPSDTDSNSMPRLWETIVVQIGRQITVRIGRTEDEVFNSATRHECHHSSTTTHVARAFGRGGGGKNDPHVSPCLTM